MYKATLVGVNVYVTYQKKKMLMLPRETNQHSMNKKENISLYTQMEKNMALLKSIMTMFKITKGTYRIFSQIIKIGKKKKANSIILLLKTAYPNKNEQNQTPNSETAHTVHLILKGLLKP